jgi:hypothetical protein
MDDTWSPDTSDVDVALPVFILLGSMCMAALLVIPKIRRWDHEA